MEKWIKELKQCCQSKSLFIAIAGNKADLKNQESISPEEGQAIALKYEALFYSTSASTGEGINHLMEDLVESNSVMVF